VGLAAWLVGGGICLLAVYFTYTRGAWLGLLCGGVPLFWQVSASRGVTFRRRFLFLAAVVGFAALLVVSPSESLRGRASDMNTVYFRINIWAAGLRMVLEHPVMGVGFAQFTSYVPDYLQAMASIPFDKSMSAGSIAHNTFLSVAAELGLVGLALYGLALLGVYRTASGAAGDAWGKRGRTWVAGMTLIYLVNVQFITAHELLPNVLYFGMMGIVAGMRRSNGAPTPDPRTSVSR
jgi:O-antigen ligase